MGHSLAQQSVIHGTHLRQAGDGPKKGWPSRDAGAKRASELALAHMPTKWHANRKFAGDFAITSEVRAHWPLL